MGSLTPETETHILSDTQSHGPSHVTVDPTIQHMGNALRQLGSADGVTPAGEGASASGTGDARDVFLGSSPIGGSQECPKWLWHTVRRRILPTWLTRRSVSSVSILPKTKRL